VYTSFPPAHQHILKAQTESGNKSPSHIEECRKSHIWPGSHWLTIVRCLRWNLRLKVVWLAWSAAKEAFSPTVIMQSTLKIRVQGEHVSRCERLQIHLDYNSCLSYCGFLQSHPSRSQSGQYRRESNVDDIMWTKNKFHGHTKSYWGGVLLPRGFQPRVLDRCFPLAGSRPFDFDAVTRASGKGRLDPHLRSSIFIAAGKDWGLMTSAWFFAWAWANEWSVLGAWGYTTISGIWLRSKDWRRKQASREDGQLHQVLK
jgi:hypothetical protein